VKTARRRRRSQATVEAFVVLGSLFGGMTHGPVRGDEVVGLFVRTLFAGAVVLPASALEHLQGRSQPTARASPPSRTPGCPPPPVDQGLARLGTGPALRPAKLDRTAFAGPPKRPCCGPCKRCPGARSGGCRWRLPTHGLARQVTWC